MFIHQFVGIDKKIPVGQWIKGAAIELLCLYGESIPMHLVWSVCNGTKVSQSASPILFAAFELADPKPMFRITYYL